MAATVKQLNFINSLISERDVPADVKERIYEIAMRPDASPARGGEVSIVIDSLLKLPKKGQAVVAAAAAPRERVNDFVSRDIPCARYVLSLDQVGAGARDLFGHNLVIFVEVRDFKDTRYVRQLHGAPGSYSRSKVTPVQRRAIAEALAAVGPLVATQRYSAMYSVCSCCGAELTEDESRRVGMGPTCRKRFGL